MGYLKHLVANPLLAAALGWIMVPLIFMVITVATMMQVKIEISFLVTAPFLFVGLVCWILGFFTGCFYTAVGPARKEAFLGLLFCLAPVFFLYLAQLAFDFGVSF